ncbi:MAG: hypothetical protein FIA91_04895 [Geobacter sp.]|nr:hypothetical protein [Geobacter sp.]
MTLIRFSLLLLLVLIPLSGHAASPVKARTLSGVGVVRITESAATSKVPLYREPGLGLLQTVSLTALPSLRLNGINLDRLYFPVIAKKRGWLKVVLDDAERTGWLAMGRGWEFNSWERFLENRQITMLRGLRKDYYLLRKAAAITADPLGSMEKSSSLVCREIIGEWAMVETAGGVSGWLRWRDENGRLLLTADVSP